MPDPKAIESMAAQAEPADRIMIYCVAARYLNKRGHTDAAIDCLKRCYFGYDGCCADEGLVGMGVHDLGIDTTNLVGPPNQPGN